MIARGASPAMAITGEASDAGRGEVAASPAGRDARIEAELAALALVDLPGLRRRWRRMLGRPAPEHLPRPLLHRMLAYRIQATAYGDLDRQTARQLARLGRHDTCGASERDGGSVDRPGNAGLQADAIPLPVVSATRPGTELVREWQGQLHRVTVLERGYAWNSTTYDSLSSVARAITGTQWNGPRFFGLRAKPGGERVRRDAGVQSRRAAPTPIVGSVQ